MNQENQKKISTSNPPTYRVGGCKKTAIPVEKVKSRQGQDVAVAWQDGHSDRRGTSTATAQ